MATGGDLNQLGIVHPQLQSKLQPLIFPDTCTIRRATSISDGMGGTTATGVNVATNVLCRLVTLQRVSFQSDTVTADQMALDASYIVELPVGTDVRNTDKILIGTRIFEVRSAVTPSWKATLRVPVVEIT